MFPTEVLEDKSSSSEDTEEDNEDGFDETVQEDRRESGNGAMNTTEMQEGRGKNQRDGQRAKEQLLLIYYQVKWIITTVPL